MKVQLNKEMVKQVGNASYRIGKDIVREGTKVVIGKTVGAAVGALITGKMEGVKNLTLNDVLGDISRKERKVARKLRREKKKFAKEKGIDVDQVLDDDLLRRVKDRFDKEGVETGLEE